MRGLGSTIGPGIIVALWNRFARKRAPISTATAPSLDRLDPIARRVLKTVVECEPYTLREIAGIPRAVARECLDRMNTMGIVKCELTVSRADPKGRTVWTVYPEFKRAASQL